MPNATLFQDVPTTRGTRTTSEETIYSRVIPGAPALTAGTGIRLRVLGLQVPRASVGIALRIRIRLDGTEIAEFNSAAGGTSMTAPVKVRPWLIDGYLGFGSLMHAWYNADARQIAAQPNAPAEDGGPAGNNGTDFSMTGLIRLQFVNGLAVLNPTGLAGRVLTITSQWSVLPDVAQSPFVGVQWVDAEAVLPGPATPEQKFLLDWDAGSGVSVPVGGGTSEVEIQRISLPAGIFGASPDRNRPVEVVSLASGDANAFQNVTRRWYLVDSGQLFTDASARRLRSRTLAVDNTGGGFNLPMRFTICPNEATSPNSNSQIYALSDRSIRGDAVGLAGRTNDQSGGWGGLSWQQRDGIDLSTAKDIVQTGFYASGAGTGRGIRTFDMFAQGFQP